MQLWRSLLGLFSMFFVSCLIFLSILAFDAQHDLSSRASETFQEPDITLPSVTPQLTVLGSKDLYSLSLSGQPLWRVTNHYLLDESGLFSASFVSSTQKFNPFGTLTGLMREAPGDVVKYSTNNWSVSHSNYLFINNPVTVSTWSNPLFPNLVIYTTAPKSYDYQTFVDMLSSLVQLEPTQVLGATLDQSSRLTNLIKPSVLRVFNQYCTEAELVTTTSPIKHPFCHTTYGTGFFVSNDGHIATNGHVVVTTDAQALQSAIGTGKLDGLIVDALSQQFSSIGIQVATPYLLEQVTSLRQSPDGILRLVANLIEMKDKKQLKFGDGTYKYTVYYGTNPVKTYEATLVDKNYQDYDAATGFTSSDIAILKTAQANTPGLGLDILTDAGVGSDIYLFGYPGLATSDQSSLLDSVSNSEISVTRGIVSSIKYAKGDKRRLIQTDASISQGNSGGPAVSSDGKVIGLATYGLTPTTGSGNYNFLRDSQDLQAILKDFQISDSSPTFTLWQQALKLYYLSYFKQALPLLNEVQVMYTDHATVSEFISDSQAKVDTVLDKSPRFSNSQRQTYLYLAVLGLTVSLTAILILLSTRRRFVIAQAPYKFIS